MKIRFSKKLILLITGVVLVLSGTSAAYAIYTSKDPTGGGAAHPAPAGVACTTIETLKIRRNGQRWIRKYVSTDSTDGVQRVRTALRVAALLVKQEKADLYQVVVLDAAGPTERAARRGSAVGAEVLFTPDPKAVPGMAAPFVARYNDANANAVGLFYGREVELAMADIQSTITAMDDKSDCIDPVAIAAAAAVAAGSESGEHGAPAGHGEEAATEEHGDGESAGHGDAEAPAHGDEAASGEDAAAPAHGEEAAAPGHGAAEPEKQGFFGSMMSMVFGSKVREPAAAPEHAPTEPAAGHGAPLAEEKTPVSASEVTPTGHGTEEGAAEPVAHGNGEPAHEEAEASAH